MTFDRLLLFFFPFLCSQSIFTWKWTVLRVSDTSRWQQPEKKKRIKGDDDKREASDRTFDLLLRLVSERNDSTKIRVRRKRRLLLNPLSFPAKKKKKKKKRQKALSPSSASVKRESDPLHWYPYEKSRRWQTKSNGKKNASSLTSSDDSTCSFACYSLRSLTPFTPIPEFSRNR